MVVMFSPLGHNDNLVNSSRTYNSNEHLDRGTEIQNSGINLTPVNFLYVPYLWKIYSPKTVALNVKSYIITVPVHIEFSNSL